MSRTRRASRLFHPKPQDPGADGREHFYFVVFVVSTGGSTQRIENGVIGYHKSIDCLADIRDIERMIRERSVAVTGGAMLVGQGTSGVSVRVMDYKVVRRE